MLGRIRSYLVWRLVLRHPRVHRLLTVVTAPDRDVDIRLLGVRLRVNRRREHGYFRAARLADKSPVLQWETASLMSLALILDRNDTFVDVGANVGLYATQIAKAQGLFRGLRIYAFEAHPETAKRLAASLADRATEVHVVALSDKDEELAFVDGAVSFVFGVQGHSSAHFQTPVPSMLLHARRLDSFPIEGGALIIKIDVEGHERPVLDGASAFFEQQRVKAVYLDGYEDRGIPDWLEERGFRLFDGRSLAPGNSGFSLLAIHRKWLPH